MAVARCCVRCLALSVAVALFAGCGDEQEQGDGAAARDVPAIAGLTSGANCPTANALSYANFGRAFIASYCLRCHSAAITGALRNAPLDRNFDELDSIRMLARLIDQQAGAGPLAVHDVMPPDPPAPPLDQRQQLAAWLACGAP
jgi:uncharacterized membrane protein